ncbi:unnamed protein product [Macrosiphum euphorbiae]|uniref:Uncharacterized protein n=1 Tax=Macrosiphum euphorbiae TaxID=13131 RepID=A0AAV0W5P3_9HEMI|nr:unnamed protein product [Macrosiphum euphorbiae]
MGFPDRIVVDLFDSQAEKTYVRPWLAEKYGKQADDRKLIVRVVDGPNREINGKCRNKAKLAGGGHQKGIPKGTHL